MLLEQFFVRSYPVFFALSSWPAHTFHGVLHFQLCPFFPVPIPHINKAGSFTVVEEHRTNKSH